MSARELAEVAGKMLMKNQIMIERLERTVAQLAASVNAHLRQVK